MFRRNIKSIEILLVLGLALLAVVSIQAKPANSAAGEPPADADFVRIASKGFYNGEGKAVEDERRQNSIAWSMSWWKGKLYVGTSRSAACVEDTAFFDAFPFFKDQVEPDPDVVCPADPHDMQLQAEIWRWTPETNAWDRVYQSPNDVPIPDPNNPGQVVPGKFVARDIGFRGMLVFREPDGTEALYVGGVSARELYPSGPPPRILRSTDGVSFEPLQLDPDTFSRAVGFRSLTAYKGRLYVSASIELLGQGPVYEAADPAGGDFRRITPDGENFYDTAVFNGYLYIGAGDRLTPYYVQKTDATGWPYKFTTVVPDAAYFPSLQGILGQGPGISIVSMHVFKDRLYVGTDRPAELFRINPDDTWELVIGRPRDTPDGRKEPLGGMDVGFDYWMNVHIWRMQSHNGVLYVGTMDHSTRLRTRELVEPYLQPAMGFDLFASSDGANFSIITRTGLGDKFNVGLRTLVSTPRGLFIGSNNYFYGLNVWRATFGDDGGYKLFLPLVGGRGQDGSAPPPVAGSAPPPVAKPQTPENIQAEIIADRPETKACEARYENDYADYVVSWTPLPEATAYRVYRADFLLDGHFPTLGNDPGFQVPGPFKLIATTEKPYYVDDNNGNCELFAGDIYQYRIVALNTEGVSRPSIVVRVPNLQTPLTFRGLENTLEEWAAQSPTTAQGINSTVRPALAGAETAVRAGDLAGARQRLEQLQQTLAGTAGLMEPWRREALGLLLDKLIRRVELVQLNILAADDLP